MGRKCCHPECYVTCLQTHKAMVLQLEYMKQQADETKQEFFSYLLGMAISEARTVIACAAQEALLQKI